MDYESDKDDRNILDVAKDLLKIWPFSQLFPETTKVTRDNVNKKKVDEEISEPETKKERIIGKNIDLGIDQGLGMLHFVLKYETQMETLKVIMFQGKNLVGKDPRGTSDPYAVITFDPKFREHGEYKTEVKLKTLNPIWNHVFVFLNFTHNDIDRHKIHITVYDWDKYGDHEPLGEVYYDLIKLQGKDHEEHSEHNDSELPHTENSVKSDDRSIVEWVRGTDSKFEIEEPEKPVIHITEEDEKTVEKSASMIFNQNLISDEEMEDEDEEEVYLLDKNDEKEDDEESEESGIPLDNADDNALDIPKNKILVNIIRRIEIKKHLQALPNSRSAYGEILISLEYAIRTRELVVKIIKAKNMIDPNKRALIPYCTIRHLFISNDREKTKSIHHTSYRFYSETPVWNEEFPLKVSPDKLKQTAVEIQVFHSTKESKLKDEVLGLIRLGLKTYPAQKAHYVEFLSNIGRPISHWHLIRS